MPGKKNVFRLYSNDGHALIDLLQLPDEPPPEVNKRVLCRHPFQVWFYAPGVDPTKHVLFVKKFLTKNCF